MKRPLVACLALVATLLPGPASAAPTALAVEDEGPGVTALNLSCADPTTTNGQKRVTHVAGPGTPPLGTGSLRLDLTADEQSGLAFEGGSRLLSELAVPGTFAVSAYSPGGVGVLVSHVRATLAGGTWHGVATLPLPVGTWTPLDLSTVPYNWVDDANANPTTLTLAAFVADGTKGNGTFRAGVMVDACTGNTPLFVDALTGYDNTGAPRTFDFESVYGTSLTIGGGGVITAGAQVDLTTVLSTNGPGLKNNEEVQLQADTWPLGDGFVTVENVKTKQNGPTSGKDKPLRATAYRWFYPGATLYASAISSTVTVKVRTLVSIRVKDDTIKRGRKAVVKGATTPAKAGVKVKLFRKTGSGKKLLATKQTRANGTYRFAKRLSKTGKWKLFVKVAPATGNLAGKSPKAVVRVS